MIKQELIQKKLQEYFNTPGLGQTASLMSLINKDETLQRHFDLSDPDKTHGILRSLTLKQHNYLLHLILHKKRDKLNKMLVSIGFKLFGEQFGLAYTGKDEGRQPQFVGDNRAWEKFDDGDNN